jgi:rhodanese-related sulfurtransferase
MIVRLPFVEPSELKQLQLEEEITLIDVREPGEYASEHIEGAILVPLSTISQEKLPSTSKSIILYCQSGKRSQLAAQQLAATGLKIRQLQGGINAWKQEGFAIKINKNAPISMMRQVQIVAGSLVVIGTLLGAFVSPWFLTITGFVGSGLVFAGITNTCALAILLAKLPYNHRI